MNAILSRKPSAQVEPLEQRIAPAVLVNLVPVTLGTPQLLDANPATDAIPQGITQGLNGPILLYVEKGSALIFTNDYNGNNIVDFNEITGIAAGDGLRLVSFVDIHGDIVTNLRPDGTLTDSDGIASNGRDGQILLNNKIESIQLRSVRQDELPLNTLITDKIALSSYSIFGNIYAGGGFGTLDGGLTIDTSGETVQQQRFNNASSTAVWVETKPQIGSIRVGTAASGRSFTFGASLADDAAGTLQQFTPPSNAAGADIINVRTLDPNVKYNLGTLQAGNGGYNGRGGDIVNVIVSGDTAGGYGLIAGDAGPGPTGQRGGNIQNWVDYGSITSEVIIKTGNGGQGLVGRGGDGGSVTFGDILPIDHDNDPNTAPLIPESAANLTARLKITLGNGGSGLTGGGNGGSFPNAKFTAVEPALGYPLEVVSSWRKSGDIGTLFTVGDDGLPIANTDQKYHALRGIDFDGDGANDVVYTATQNNGNQAGSLVVLFGNPALPGTFDETRTLFLDAPDNPEALTVGDFNGDGNPDIAVASGNLSAAGVQVILSHYDSLTGDFVGFGDSIYSPLAAIGGAIITFGTGAAPARAPQAFEILEMATGDFDKDGAMDIGVMTTEGFYLLRGDFDPGVNGGANVPTGRVFSDTASNGGLIPGERDGDVIGDFPVIKATALSDGGLDVIFASTQGIPWINAYTYEDAFLLSVSIDLGSVDTNREVSDVGKTDKISTTEATIKDFTFLDINGDGKTEVSMLTASPEGYLVNLTDTDGSPFTATGALSIFERYVSNRFGTAAADSDENRGIRVGGRSTPSNFGLDLSDGGLVGIMTHTLFDGTKQVNSVMLMDYDVSPTNITFVTANVLRFTAAPGAGESPNYISMSLGTRQIFGPAAYDYNNADQSVRAFDVWAPSYNYAGSPGNPPAPVASGVLLGIPTKDAAAPFLPGIAGAGVFVPLERNGFFIKAGNGGDSANGKGGLGGSIGSTLRFDAISGDAVGSFDITLPAFIQYYATVRIVAGDGGDGFRDAGAGGSITGVSVRHGVGVDTISNSGLLLAGHGGNSIKGKGGKGGDVKSVFIEGGDLFVAGDGGNGVVGGVGGAVIGNSFGLEDTTAAVDRDDINNVEGVTIAVLAGHGGSGVKTGGNGGDILGFTPRFLNNLSAGDGIYHLRAGDGGNATIGVGGRGGNVFDSSPTLEQNRLNGSIFVMGGSGGNGSKGGAGGNIRNFVNEASGGTAFSTTFLAGNGGIGTTGPGGVGGSISQVRTDGTGVGRQVYFDLSDRDSIELLSDALSSFAYVPFSRMVAGEGGASLGSVGGNGGSVTDSLGTAQTSTFAIASGRGGDGLLRGGNGGSVMNVTSNSGSQFTTATFFGIVDITKPQVLVIAGEGGDAYSGLKRDIDPLAPGRQLPTAGNGGSIINFSQPSGQDINVHLIAGNGGNTPNAGSSQDLKSKVGKGGSIQNIAVAGNIGDTGDPTDNVDSPIKPYNPLYGNGSNPNGPNDPSDDRMSVFVRNSLVGDPEALPPPPIGSIALPLVNGDTGNVGIVVGAKGRVRDNNNDGKLDAAPEAGVVPNGSLINVVANNIMSAVAGNVDRIASIQVLQNVRVEFVGGEFGSDRDIDTLGNTQAPDGMPYSLGSTSASLDYVTEEGVRVPTPTIGGRLVDGAIVAKTSRAPKSSRDFPIG